MAAVATKLTRDGATLRKVALGYPEAYEDMPWGHHAIEVKSEVLKLWIDET
jgi:hypothetical protein